MDLERSWGRPDGKILWPIQNIRLGRALVSIYPTAGEEDRGFFCPPIFARGGELSVYNPPLGVLLVLRIPPRCNLWSWFEEQGEYELLTLHGRGREMNRILLGRLEGHEAEELLLEAEDVFPPDSPYVTLDMDVAGNLRSRLARAAGHLVSARQLKSTKYIAYTTCEVHPTYLHLSCEEADLYVRYRQHKRRRRPSDGFARVLRTVSEAPGTGP